MTSEWLDGILTLLFAPIIDEVPLTKHSRVQYIVPIQLLSTSCPLLASLPTLEGSLDSQQLETSSLRKPRSRIVITSLPIIQSTTARRTQTGRLRAATGRWNPRHTYGYMPQLLSAQASPFSGSLIHRLIVANPPEALHSSSRKEMAVVNACLRRERQRCTRFGDRFA